MWRNALGRAPERSTVMGSVRTATQIYTYLCASNIERKARKTLRNKDKRKLNLLLNAATEHQPDPKIFLGLHGHL